MASMIHDRLRDPRAEGEAIDAARAFVGYDAQYYDERWRWLDWSGKLVAWNGLAGLLGPAWFAYRKMWLYSLLALLWVGLLCAALAIGFPPATPLILYGLSALGFAAYGTILYRVHYVHITGRVFRKVEGTEAREAKLRARGGTSVVAAVAIGVLCLALAGAALFYREGWRVLPL